MAEVKHFFMLLVPCLIFSPLQNGLLIVFAYFFRKLLVFDSHLFYIMVSLAFLLLCITKLISWLELQKSREIELYQSTQAFGFYTVPMFLLHMSFSYSSATSLPHENNLAAAAAPPLTG